MPGVVVIGGAGFIGSHLVDELVMFGHDVVVIDDCSSGTEDNLMRDREYRGSLHRNISFIKDDVLNLSENYLTKVFDDRKCIFYLAEKDKEDIRRLNNCLNAAFNAQAKRFVYSTSCINYEKLLSEQEAIKKVNEENIAEHTKLGLNTCVLRYATVYGPRANEESSSIMRLMNCHRRLRNPYIDNLTFDDVLFVGDVVRANMLAAMNREAIDSYDICSSEFTSPNTIIKYLYEKELHYIAENDMKYTVTANNSKAKDVLGWEQKISVENGIKITQKYEEFHPRSGIIIAKV